MNKKKISVKGLAKEQGRLKKIKAKKAEKVIDFGIYGKWSIATLKAQAYPLPVPNSISDIYHQINADKKTIEDTKLKKIKTLFDLICLIKDYDTAKRNIALYREIIKAAGQWKRK